MCGCNGNATSVAQETGTSGTPNYVAVAGILAFFIGIAYLGTSRGSRDKRAASSRSRRWTR